MQMVEGNSDVLWHGVTRNFAQSSGTSDGKSKYVPITKESFSRCHYRGGCRLRGALSGNESSKPHFRRQGIHPRRQLRQRAAPAERRGGGRPVGKPYQQHQPACQPCAHPRQADSTHGRLEQEAAGSCRGKPSAERDQHLRRAVVVSVGDKRSDAQGGCRVNPRRVAQSGSVFPRRHQLQALPQSI